MAAGEGDTGPEQAAQGATAGAAAASDSTPGALPGAFPPAGPAAIDRRTFLRGAGGGAVLLAGALLPSAHGSLAGCAPRPVNEPEESQGWWKDGGRYFVQDSVDSSRQAEGVIRARVDGRWQTFRTVALPRSFVEWSLGERRARLETLARGEFHTRDLAGPHNACVATYGGPLRPGSLMSLNTAYKGMGWCPRPELLDTVLGRLRDEGGEPRSQAEYMATMRRKAQVLGELYARPELYDLHKQVSLELFTTWAYSTHTFLNMMANPVASASFLAYPTFELRAIPQLLHPDDPGLTPQERKIVQYVNRIHSYVHGGEQVFSACIYHVIEVYDDTPAPRGKGRKLA